MTCVNRYHSGELDVTYNQLPVELLQRLKKEVPNELHVDPYLCTYYYEISNQKTPFTDVRARIALKLGLGRSIIADKVRGRGGLLAYGYTPPYTDDVKLSEPE